MRNILFLHLVLAAAESELGVARNDEKPDLTGRNVQLARNIHVGADMRKICAKDTREICAKETREKAQKTPTAMPMPMPMPHLMRRRACIVQARVDHCHMVRSARGSGRRSEQRRLCFAAPGGNAGFRAGIPASPGTPSAASGTPHSRLCCSSPRPVRPRWAAGRTSRRPLPNFGRGQSFRAGRIRSATDQGARRRPWTPARLFSARGGQGGERSEATKSRPRSGRKGGGRGGSTE